MAIVKRKNTTGARPAYPVAPSAATATAPVAPSAAAGTQAQPVTSSPELRELGERVERLRNEFAELQWNIGGLAYEMAARNYFKLEVLREHAAELQRIDAELGEATRLMSIERASAGGDCPRCGSLFGTGAFYCWNCGFSLDSGAARV